MKKPYVTIHTHTSLDGKIHSIDLPEFEAASLQYQELALYPDKQVFNIQGYMNGRITTDDNTTLYRKPELNEQADIVPEGDFIADTNTPMYYISYKVAFRYNVRLRSEEHTSEIQSRGHLVCRCVVDYII